MKKLYLIFTSIIIAVASTLGALCLAGCSKTYDVTTVDGLYAMERDKSYRLAADLDLAGREWKPLRVNSFDGGGHTIKNLVMYDGSGFFTNAEVVANVTFESMNVMSSNHYFGFVVGEGKASNVHVKNCTATLTVSTGYTYIGAVVGRGRTVENCVVSDCILNCNLSGYASIGGISGESTSRVSNCTVDSVTIRGSGGARVGGIVGFFDGSNTAAISDCTVADSTIELVTGTTAYVGGIVGSSVQNVSERDSGVVERCAARGNHIAVTTGTAEADIGGIIGHSSSTLNDCLSKNNLLSLSSSSASGYIGGVIGYTQRNAEKCIGYDNTLIDVNSSGGRYCGFVARVNNAMAVHCATHDIAFEGATRRDDFAFESSDMAMYCYFDNIDVNEITDEQWLDGETVHARLALDPEIWTAKSGELPDLIKKEI